MRPGPNISSAVAGLSVFTNPSTGSFALQLPQHAQARSLSVHDATGRVVLSRSIVNTSGPVAMGLSGQESEVHLVQVLFANGTRAVARVIKE